MAIDGSAQDDFAQIECAASHSLRKEQSSCRVCASRSPRTARASRASVSSRRTTSAAGPQVMTCYRRRLISFGKKMKPNKSVALLVQSRRDLDAAAGKVKWHMSPARSLQKRTEFFCIKTAILRSTKCKPAEGGGNTKEVAPKSLHQNIMPVTSRKVAPPPARRHGSYLRSVPDSKTSDQLVHPVR